MRVAVMCDVKVGEFDIKEGDQFQVVDSYMTKNYGKVLILEGGMKINQRLTKRIYKNR